MRGTPGRLPRRPRPPTLTTVQRGDGTLNARLMREVTQLQTESGKPKRSLWQHLREMFQGAA